MILAGAERLAGRVVAEGRSASKRMAQQAAISRMRTEGERRRAKAGSGGATAAARPALGAMAVAKGRRRATDKRRTGDEGVEGCREQEQGGGNCWFARHSRRVPSPLRHVMSRPVAVLGCAREEEWSTGALVACTERLRAAVGAPYTPFTPSSRASTSTARCRLSAFEQRRRSERQRRTVVSQRWQGPGQKPQPAARLLASTACLH